MAVANARDGRAGRALRSAAMAGRGGAGPDAAGPGRAGVRRSDPVLPLPADGRGPGVACRPAGAGADDRADAPAGARPGRHHRPWRCAAPLRPALPHRVAARRAGDDARHRAAAGGAARRPRGPGALGGSAGPGRRPACRPGLGGQSRPGLGSPPVDRARTAGGAGGDCRRDLLQPAAARTRHDAAAWPETGRSDGRGGGFHGYRRSHRLS